MTLSTSRCRREAPTALPRDLALTVSLILNRLDPPGFGSQVEERDAPSAQTRVKLLARLDRVRDWMRSASLDDMKAWLGPILWTRGNSQVNEAEADILFRVYWRNHDDQPGFALEAACRAIERGEAPGVSLEFRPTPAQVRVEAQRQARSLLREQREIGLVLEARVRKTNASPERRAEVAAAVRSAVRSFAGASSRMPSGPPSLGGEVVAEAPTQPDPEPLPEAGRPMEPVRVSVNLANWLGLPAEQAGTLLQSTRRELGYGRVTDPRPPRRPGDRAHDRLLRIEESLACGLVPVRRVRIVRRLHGRPLRDTSPGTQTLPPVP